MEYYKWPNPRAQRPEQVKGRGHFRSNKPIWSCREKVEVWISTMTTANKQTHCRNIGLTYFSKPILFMIKREREKKKNEKKKWERTNEKSDMFINIYIKPFGYLSLGLFLSLCLSLSLSHTHTPTHTHTRIHLLFLSNFSWFFVILNFTISSCISAGNPEGMDMKS